MVEAEFEYTERMFRTDLSNFSALHNRSQLIPRLLDERGATAAQRKAFFDTGRRRPILKFLKQLTDNVA